MATLTLPNPPAPEDSFSGTLIPDLIRTVEKVEVRKPPQPHSGTLQTEIPEDPRDKNAAMLISLWEQGEQMGTQAFELPHPKPDPLTVALNGFPDVFTSWAYQQGQ